MEQYRDRQSYWSVRGCSRLQVQGHICLILDGMDQCKFLYPRTPLMRAKDLALMNRPKLHITGIICHGFFLAFSVSNHDHPKDSSVSAELICWALTQLSRQLDLRKCYIHVVSDNTSRETKNNTTLRLLGSLTLHGLVAGCSLRNLRSGHSHEDIDQVFGSLALWLVKHGKLLETPDHFLTCVQRFCCSAKRPQEAGRLVVKLDQHRDWTIGLL